MLENEKDLSIVVSGLSYSYDSEGEGQKVLKNINLKVHKGLHVALLGRNGSGKSSLARLLNALDFPDEGTIYINGENAKDFASALKIRQNCGMVFQNPDNQIIGTSLEEDVAFGPENLGVSPEIIRKRIKSCLAMVGLEADIKEMPAKLSGGQKQKLAIAGILAMEPRIIILDEATSMLDPKTRKEFLSLCEDLRKKYNLTFVNITHHMEEALLADYIYVLDEGEIKLEGTSKEIFARRDLVEKYGLLLPFATEFYQNLVSETKKIFDFLDSEFGFSFTIEEEKEAMKLGFDANFREAVHKHEIEKNISLLKSLWQKILTRIFEESKPEKWAKVLEFLAKLSTLAKNNEQEVSKETLMSIDHVSYEYPSMNDDAKLALKAVSFTIKKGEILGIMGATGSSKSTLVQHLNALIRPKDGEICLIDPLTKKIYYTHNKKDVKEIRKRVGLLFQYPEHQLFAHTVYEDIAFGGKMMGLSSEEIERRINKVLEITSLDKEVLTRSPFELSGGQKRKVALAGVLIMEPLLLILDEPTAGLDPHSARQVLDLVKNLRASGISIVIVSHSMEYLAEICDRFLVLDEGKVAKYGNYDDVFVNQEDLQALELDIPEVLIWNKFLLDCGWFKTLYMRPGHLPVRTGAELVDRCKKEIYHFAMQLGSQLENEPDSRSESRPENEPDSQMENKQSSRQASSGKKENFENAN